MRISFLLALVLLSANVSAAENCDPQGKVYPVCADQKTVLADALAKAKTDKKPLLLVFGADWCPWCLSLHKILRDAELAEAAGYSIAEIALYKGEDKLPSGVEALDRVLAFAKQKKVGKGIPLLALVNPMNEKATFINTEPLEKNTKVSKGHDPKKLFAALAKAEKKIQ
ncbi:MAG: thioredoxin family protein [Bacteriovoracia bacterium]